VIVDIGSGLLSPHPLLPDEPDAATALRAGAALITASGDKLLGGPQAGIVLGQAALVEELRRHPMARALRVDKLTLAALEATIMGPPPTVRAALDTPVETLRSRADLLARQLRADGVDAQSVTSVAAVGGGAAPGVELPSFAVSVPATYAQPLRCGRVPVVGRTVAARCLLDLRTVPPADDDALHAAIVAAHRLVTSTG
jgi:L-seryl-tRNA(Ser) seleniumtransferase